MRRPAWRLILPGLVALCSLWAWWQVWQSLQRPANPGLLAVEHVERGSGWRSFRLFCSEEKLAMPALIVDDGFWASCHHPRLGPEIVRFDLKQGLIQRRWPLPAGLHVTEGMGEAIAIQGALLQGNDLILIAVRRAWQVPGDPGAGFLLRLRYQGGLEVITQLPPWDRWLAGFTLRGEQFEIMTDRCERFVVDTLGAVRAHPSVCKEGSQLEAAYPAHRGWRMVTSRALRPEYRDLFMDGVPLGSMGPRDQLGGGRVDRSAANVLPDGPPTHRLDGRTLTPIKETAGVSAFGAGRAFSLAHAGLKPSLAGRTEDGAVRLQSGKMVMWLRNDDGGLHVSPTPAPVDALVSRGWTALSQLVVPASNGGWWLADRQGRSLHLDGGLRPGATPEPLERLLRAFEGELGQPAAKFGGAEDGLLPAAEFQRSRQLTALWLFLVIGILVLLVSALLDRWWPSYQALGAVWLVAAAVFLRDLLTVLPLL